MSLVSAVAQCNIDRLEQVYALLVELDDSAMVTRLSEEMDTSIPALMESVSAFIGALRIERDAA